MNQPDERPGALAGTTACHWGSVNQWECDENDHLNVRYYAHKMNQALQILIAERARIDPPAVLPRIRTQHIRFLRESRAATPVRVDCAISAVTPASLHVLSLMHDNVSGEVLAAFQTSLDATGLALADDRTGPSFAVPEFARPRGLDPAQLPGAPDTWDQARSAGFRIVGRGVIGPEECDAHEALLPHVYIGRVSDGMPNLWALLNPASEQAARAAGGLGGAALEQRLTILAPLHRGAVFTQLSGVRRIGNKTQQMAHVLYDETHNRVAATVEALGVAMDLTTRRAVPISAQRRAHLEALLLR
ncbi:MAG: hypothetical protein RIC56_02835 [Pseudomonadales bacterium]